MKRFNPDREIEKITGKSSVTRRTNKTTFIPVLVLSCAILTTFSLSFSHSVTTEKEEFYTIKIDILNGEDSTYIKKIAKSNNNFSDTIFSDASFGNLTCTKGTLFFDPSENRVYNDDVKEDTNCVLAFMNDGSKKIEISSLETINDNTGTSYYYKGEAENNYLKIKNILFRIIRLNGDGSLRLITNTPIEDNVSFLEQNERIKNWYKDNLSDRDSIIMTDFDTTNYEQIDLTSLINYDGYNLDYVGLLSVKEAQIINKGVKESFLSGNYFLANEAGIDKVWIMNQNEVKQASKAENASLRPVINIKAEKLKGQGTINNPYEIE